jgi:hypothetical protein
MKMYRYFVSYAYNRINGNCSFRNCTVERECKIESIDDIKSISEALEEQKDVKINSVAIISYQLMSEYKSEVTQ